ncbi:hypothetical protein IAQ61_009586 [Plenodomus lingam]|uniref:uncharacterized protein n=1 Tax=Leptosphaeria maculans TaxID=5022 RepID=UPI0033198AD1|nr:hypothetical protein IAQ61_009586 [Plenodomus lingam]
MNQMPGIGGQQPKDSERAIREATAESAQQDRRDYYQADRRQIAWADVQVSFPPDEPPDFAESASMALGINLCPPCRGPICGAVSPDEDYGSACEAATVEHRSL